MDLYARTLAVSDRRYSPRYGLETLAIRSSPTKRVPVDEYRERLLRLLDDAKKGVEPDPRMASVFPRFDASVPLDFKLKFFDLRVTHGAFILEGKAKTRGTSSRYKVEERLTCQFYGHRYALVVSEKDVDPKHTTLLMYMGQYDVLSTATIFLELTKRRELRKVYVCVDVATVPRQALPLNSASTWSSDRTLFNTYNGAAIERETLYLKLSKDIYDLKASEYTWQGVHCLVDFPDIDLVHVSAEDEHHDVRLYIEQPRALFVIYPSTQMNTVNIDDVVVELRHGGTYKQLSLRGEYDDADDEYFAIVDSGKDWLIAVRMQIARSQSSLTSPFVHRIQKIEVLYENVDHQAMYRDAVSIRTTRDEGSVTDDDTSSEGASTDSEDDEAEPMTTSSSSSSSSTASSSSSSSPFPTSSSTMSLTEYRTLFDTLPSPSDFNLQDTISETISRLKKKRFDFPTSYRVDEPERAKTTNVFRSPDNLQSLSVHVEHRVLRFIPNDDAMPIYLHYEKFFIQKFVTFTRALRYLIHVSFLAGSKKERLSGNLKLERDAPSDDNEYYQIDFDKYTLVFHFYRSILRACLVHAKNETPSKILFDGEA